MEQFIKGADLSTLLELEACGAKYYDHGTKADVLSILKKYGVNSIRLRVWVDPYSETGEAYGAGGNDTQTSIAIGKRVSQAGFGVLLNLHYSDFWADPGKQIKPKAWKDYGAAKLEQAIYEYTVTTVSEFLKAGVNITMIQVGNELSNGLCWPEGKVPNYDTIAMLLNAGIRACRKVNPQIPIMLHLDNGGNNALYREWFDEFMKRGEAFEYIGLSYYPFWHGTLAQLEANMQDIAKRYNKDLIVAEVSMGYTMEDYAAYEGLEDKPRKGYATRPALAEKIEYPMTPQGQSDFMQDFMMRIAKVEHGRGKGFYYWEPAWIPVPGSGWATEASLRYMQDPGPCGNEWANQALFDYEGNALPALETIQRFTKLSQ